MGAQTISKHLIIVILSRRIAYCEESLHKTLISRSFG